MNRIYSLKHSAIDFLFKQNKENFIVKEKALYEFSKEGEHLILKIRKKDISTWEMLSHIAKTLKIKEKDLGYAGLKDKNALSTQHISINRKYENIISKIENENIKILESTYHNNKIKIGHLKGNDFSIKLKKVSKSSAVKIKEALEHLRLRGMPNFFGYQRFGKDNENYKKAKLILEDKLKERNIKKRKFFINAYQSHLFNSWLNKRLEISHLINEFNKNELRNILEYENIDELKKQKNFFKLLKGDIAMHYPYGKIFEISKLEEETCRFEKREIVPTGMLSGKKAKKALSWAWDIEKDFYEEINISGGRRYAWVFLEDLSYEYKEENAWFFLKFFLPKGSYATILLEEIAKKDIKVN